MASTTINKDFDYICNDIQFIKKCVLTQFSVNNRNHEHQAVIAKQVQENICAVLPKITVFLNNYPNHDYSVRLLTDANHLIRLHQIADNKDKNSVLQNVINDLFKTTTKVLSECNISKKSRKAIRPLHEKLAFYSEKNILPKPVKNNYVRISAKKGGVSSTGPLGGIYENQSIAGKIHRPKMLVKRETEHDKPLYGKIIAEFLGGTIIRELVGDQAAKINFQQPLKDNPPPEDIYIGSHFFNDYCDLYKFSYWLHDKKEPKDRPKFVGSINRGPIQNTVLLCAKKSEFANITSAMLSVGMFDMHSANIGFDGGKLVCLDFASAFSKLHKKIHAHSQLHFLPGFGPTNHFREYPRTMRVNEEMADALEKTANFDFQPVIIKALENIKHVYRGNLEPIREFAAYTGYKNYSTANYESIGEYLQERMNARKKSLAKLALEIRIDLVIEKQDKKFVVNKEKLAELVTANPEYFAARLNDKNYHFRAHEHKSCYLARLFGLRLTENYFAKLLNEAIITLPLTDDVKHKINTQNNCSAKFFDLPINFAQMGIIHGPIIIAGALVENLKAP